MPCQIHDFIAIDSVKSIILEWLQRNRVAMSNTTCYISPKVIKKGFVIFVNL
jgi:hypothetical protein